MAPAREGRGRQEQGRKCLPPGRAQQRSAPHARRPPGDLRVHAPRLGSGPSDNEGSDGWYRIIHQAGPELTWEWFIADETKPYAALFPDELRERVRAALEGDAGTTEWRRVSLERKEASDAQAERIRLIQEDMKSGKRSRKFI